MEIKLILHPVRKDSNILNYKHKIFQLVTMMLLIQTLRQRQINLSILKSKQIELTGMVYLPLLCPLLVDLKHKSKKNKQMFIMIVGVW